MNATVGEILTGVLPVVVVDTVRDDESQNLYGMFVQAQGDALNLGACVLAAQQFDVLVHKVEFWVDAISTRAPTVHLFTPLQTYDPFDVALQNVFFPWFQGPASAPPDNPFGAATGRLSAAIGIAGLGSALMALIVNGVPVTAIGPTYAFTRWTTFVGSQPSEHRVIWGFQDPPIRLRPFQRLCVQTLLPIMLGVGHPLNVNFYYTERSEEGQLP